MNQLPRVLKDGKDIVNMATLLQLFDIRLGFIITVLNTGLVYLGGYHSYWAFDIRGLVLKCGLNFCKLRIFIII